MRKINLLELPKRQVSLKSAESLTDQQSTAEFAKNVWVENISAEQFLGHMKNKVPCPPYD
ncbi:hypothetical protein [Microcoleus sp. B9-D4]|uniref:hypothetical protein n=1 Tax=Microcoleus sp. B9-D4 TaxID=2818711 RepID=UPI002FCF3A6D